MLCMKRIKNIDMNAQSVVSQPLLHFTSKYSNVWMRCLQGSSHTTPAMVNLIWTSINGLASTQPEMEVRGIIGWDKRGKLIIFALCRHSHLHDTTTGLAGIERL